MKFLHDHGMTHTDLKPENILFIDSSYEIMWNVDRHREERILRCCEIKLIDFGSTTFDDEVKLGCHLVKKLIGGTSLGVFEEFYFFLPLNRIGFVQPRQGRI